MHPATTQTLVRKGVCNPSLFFFCYNTACLSIGSGPQTVWGSLGPKHQPWSSPRVTQHWRWPPRRPHQLPLHPQQRPPVLHTPLHTNASPLIPAPHTENHGFQILLHVEFPVQGSKIHRSIAHVPAGLIPREWWHILQNETLLCGSARATKRIEAWRLQATHLAVVQSQSSQRSLRAWVGPPLSRLPLHPLLLPGLRLPAVQRQPASPLQPSALLAASPPQPSALPASSPPLLSPWLLSSPPCDRPGISGLFSV